MAGDPGRWYEDRLPGRQDALRMAVECVTAAGGVGSAELAHVRIAAARAWAAIARAAEPLSAPAGDPVAPVVLPLCVRLGLCGHGHTGLRIGDGKWLHGPELRQCVLPPRVWMVIDHVG